MQGEAAANSGYHDSNADVRKTEDQMVEATIGTLSNFSTAPAAASGIVSTFTEENARLARQLEESSKKVTEVKALLRKERAERRWKRPFTPSLGNYYWYHGYKFAKSHTNQSCSFPKDGQKCEAVKANNMGGCQANKE
jgi:hypothetical protein